MEAEQVAVACQELLEVLTNINEEQKVVSNTIKGVIQAGLACDKVQQLSFGGT